LHSAGLRELLRLAAQKQPLCCISVGSGQARKPARPRPDAARYVSTLAPHT